MNSYERKGRICKVIVLVLGILSINNIILTIRNYSYAYFHKNVKSDIKLKITTLDEMPSKGEIATKVIKETVVPYEIVNQDNFNGGLVAINTSGTLYDETAGNQTIREYRYNELDVNNYIYYNCKDNEEPSASNCEIWRIVGVFKDENGDEHLKIVRNNVLTGDMFPETFFANNVTYKIRYSSDSEMAYWNNPKITNYNDWTTAGLQYWLNAGSDKETKKASDGYMSYLSKNSKDMIAKTKYHLGAVMNQYPNGKITDGPVEASAHERDIESCIDNTGNSATASGCRVWSGNKAIWEGSIALLYPSDYGYSAHKGYWYVGLGSFSGNSSNSSWLQKTANHSSYEWLLSPISHDSFYVASWSSDGPVDESGVNYNGFVRPCLYLKSKVKIMDGDGSKSKPFVLNLG